MSDETDISQETEWFHEQRAKVVVVNLQKRNVNAQYVANRQQALAAVLEMIPAGATVARGDSLTIEQIGILPELKKGNYRLINPFERDPGGLWVFETEERRKMQREAFSSDIFLTGTNAVTLDGKLVNTDGFGGRVAAMIFGPKKVIFVTGVNKIVKDVDEALERIHQVAAPMNARRHYFKHHMTEYADLPCVRTGKCVDCNHGWRICRYTVIIEGNSMPNKDRMNVVLVGEPLGI